MYGLVIGQKMTSKEISELSGKNHSDLMKSIRKMEPAWVKKGGGNFSLTSYVDNSNRAKPMYELTKTECLYISSKFNDETRATLVLRWEALETKNGFNLPESFPEALRLLADSKEAEQKANLQLQSAKQIIQENKSKVVFADAVAGSQNLILMREFAKELSDEGFKIGQNRLFNWFRSNKYLQPNNEPYQKYVDQGLFKVVPSVVGNGEYLRTVKTTKLTGKGQVYFAKKIRESHLNNTQLN